eukprot:1705731-Amphidinium_carterae.1
MDELAFHVSWLWFKDSEGPTGIKEHPQPRPEQRKQTVVESSTKGGCTNVALVSLCRDESLTVELSVSDRGLDSWQLVVS